MELTWRWYDWLLLYLFMLSLLMSFVHNATYKDPEDRE